MRSMIVRRAKKPERFPTAAEVDAAFKAFQAKNGGTMTRKWSARRTNETLFIKIHNSHAITSSGFQGTAHARWLNSWQMSTQRGGRWNLPGTA